MRATYLAVGWSVQRVLSGDEVMALKASSGAGYVPGCRSVQRVLSGDTEASQVMK